MDFPKLLKPLQISAEPNCPLPQKSSTLLKWTLDMTFEVALNFFHEITPKFDVQGSSDIVKISSVPETLDLLRTIDTDLAIVSIVGPYRTGKSFLLDQLTPHEEGVFPFKVGDTVRPETEEVSMLILPPCVLNTKETLIFMDSPGLFAPNRASIFDSQLLAVLNLLSSVVIYNSMNIIDRSAIEKLSYAVDTAFAMSYFEQTNEENLISRPHLIWVIQNFHLKLLDENGEELSGQDWIDRLLRHVDKSNNGTSTFQKQFTEFFSSLDVKPLPYPVANLDDLQSLSSLPSSAFDPKYRTAVHNLSEYIKEIAEPKRIGKLHMTGVALAELVRRWTENMNVPIGDYRANSAEDLLGHIMNAEVSRCTVKYSDMMSDQTKEPMSEAEIRTASDRTISIIVGSDAAPRFVESLRRAVAPLLAGYIQENEKRITELLSSLISKYNETARKAFIDSAHSAGVNGLSSLHEVEKSHLNAFQDEAAVIQSKHSVLHARALQDLAQSLSIAKESARARANAAYERYTQIMQDSISYPTTEDLIYETSDNTIRSVLGYNADPRYINALNEDAKPIIEMHIKNNQMNVIKSMVSKYNASAYAQLKETYHLKTSSVRDLRLVEESQTQAFESEAANIKRKNPELFAAALEDLNYLMLQAKEAMVEERRKLKQLYYSKMLALVKSPMTEANITAASDQVVLNILGDDADPRYIDTFREDIDPILQDFLKRNEESQIARLEYLFLKLNSTSYQLIEENVQLYGADIKQLKLVEYSQLQAFSMEAEYIKSENPELYSNLLNDLNSSMVKFRDLLIQREISMKKRFEDILSVLIVPPMSEFEIEAASMKAIHEIMGKDPDPRFVSAFKKRTQDIVQKHLQRNEASIREALETLSLSANISALKSLSDSSVAQGADSKLENYDFSEVESEHLGRFEKDSEHLQSKHPSLYSTIQAKLRNSLLLARAAAVGNSLLIRTKISLLECATVEPSSDNILVVDACLDKAQKRWSSGIMGTNLGTNWPNPDGRALLDAAGESTVFAVLRQVANSARAKLDAVGMFRGCSASVEGENFDECQRKAKELCVEGANCETAIGLEADRAVAKVRALKDFRQCAALVEGADLDNCQAKAKAKCVDAGGCETIISSEADTLVISRCEKNTLELLSASAVLKEAWWLPDSTGDWQADLMDRASLSFQEGPCSVQNSTRALDNRDEALHNLAAVSASRAGLAGMATTSSIVAAFLIGILFASLRFIVTEKKGFGAMSKTMKEMVLYISLAMAVISLVLCIMIAFKCPHLSVRLSGIDSANTSVSAEHFLLCVVLMLEVYLVSQELGKLRLTPTQTYSALHTL